MKLSYKLTSGHLLRVFMYVNLPYGIAAVLAKTKGPSVFQITGGILEFFVIPIFLPAIMFLVYESIVASSSVESIPESDLV